ncbi:hexosaminidase D-like isoform X2 [Diorhabda sublineata]|uniref:hexosaminidase D-like isoform X2 n=1 Tax=Diorhabda sublineata TaxID=1163346 RepID=UPI0024E10041|nr:hexosaminidase D-like isoform X2 [Diorhabda sublineata]
MSKKIRRFVHLDLKGAPPKPSFLETFFPLLTTLGVEGLLVEWEDSFPYTGDIQDIGSLGSSSASGGHYIPKEASEIMKLAKVHSLMTIPLIQTFGHMEFVLKHSKFKHLREYNISPSCICPSQEDSLNLIKEMIDQMLAFHTDSEYIHIGADEVWHLGQCEKCTAKMEILKYKQHSLWLDHVVAVAQYVRIRYPNTKVMLWDDMFRNIDEAILKEYNIGELVEPMVWYYHTLDDFFSPNLWNKYCNVFPHLWGATAFKGATGSRQIMPVPYHHIQNHECWIRGLALYNDQIKNFHGLVLTGWSRYDHYATLCELLPSGIPSLCNCLLTLENGKYSPEIIQSEMTSLGFILPNIHMDDTTIVPQFPGSQLYINMDWLNHFIRKYKIEIDSERFNTWFNHWQRNTKYTTPYHVNSMKSTINSLLSEIEKLEDFITSSIHDIYYEHTVEELYGTLIHPIKENLYKLNQYCLLQNEECPTKPKPID